MVRVAGIEPASQPWEGRILPLNHTRIGSHYTAGIPLFIRLYYVKIQFTCHLSSVG